MINIIFRGCFGSNLYGTSNSNSDIDIRQIHMSTLDDIIFNKDHETITKKQNSLDFESKEFKKFINDCLSGQTYAQNILHTPKHHWYRYSEDWLEIQSLKNKLVTKNINPYIAYCKSQRDKYSKKGDKLNELIKLREILKTCNPKDLLNVLYKPTDVLTFEHISVGQVFNSGSKNLEYHLKVVDSSYPLNRQIAEILKSIEGKIDAFGRRSQLAAENSGHDLKATYHAFRVAWELEQLLNYGYLTFPSPRKELLIKMRNGDYRKEFLDFWLVEEIERITKIPNHLPEKDQDFWDEWLLEKYKKELK